MRTDALQVVERLLAVRADIERREAGTAATDARLRTLRDWQARRLARTYADLRADPRCAPAAEFFLTDLYGSADVAARDRQLARAWSFFRRWLPAAPLRALEHAVELDVLTRHLDLDVAARMAELPLDSAGYARAYRATGRRKDRERQIELIVVTGRSLESVARAPRIGALLRAARMPARAAGLGLLQDVLERGYRAFGALPSPEEFLSIIRTRETALMQALFEGVGDPFAMEASHA